MKKVLKFHEIILRRFLALFTILFIIVGGIIYFWEYDFYLESSKNSLIQNIELISYGLDTKSDLDKLAKQVKQNLDLRLTVIDMNGNVIAESHKDKAQMENLRYRKEIIMSDKKSYGITVRHSTTVDKKLQYIAKKITLGSQTIYLRLARELRGINEEIIHLAIKVFSVLFLFFAALLIATYKINAQVEYEVKKIISFLKSLTKQQKTTYISSEFCQEFMLITSLLTKIAQIITKKEKRKNKYTRQLQQLNKQKDDIISAISHEFKNPIAVVNGYTQTLIEDPQLNQDIRQKFLAKIQSNGEKLSKLIDTLRLSIKLDSKQQSITITPVNIYKSIQECVETLQVNFPYRSIIISGDKEAIVAADKVMLEIVLINLIENALKYSEDEVLIDISKTHISIKDSGIGMQKKDLDLITEKFYRVNQNSWNNSLGLGLFLVKNILKLHNFKLHIESVPHQGSTFTIVF